MTWDPIWEEIFRTHEWGKYPPEELIRFIARNYYQAPDRSAVRVLEVGCGAGANVWYLAREGFSATGVDGAATAIERARRRMAAEGLAADLQVGDIVHLDRMFAPASFDAVIDVACLWCNRRAAVESMVKQIHAVLKPGGKVFSMLLGSGSYGEGTGTEVEPGTWVDIQVGPLRGRGLNRFFSREEVQRVFADFPDLKVEYTDRSLENGRHVFRLWVVEGTKA